jgi:hypothetical protein
MRKTAYHGGKFGSHSMRKTAYLMAVWGNGKFEVIMKSARHKDVFTAQKYARDAKHVLNVAKANGLNVESALPWKAVLVESPQIFRGLN